MKFASMLLWGMATVVGSAGTALFVCHFRDVPPPISSIPLINSDTNAIEQLATLTQKVSRLEQEIRTLSAVSIHIPSAQTTITEDSGHARNDQQTKTTHPPSALSIEEAVEYSRGSTAATVAEMEQKLANENIDREWSTKTRHRLEEAITNFKSYANIVDITCASTLCRAVVTHTTAEDQVNFGTLIEPLEPFQSGIFFYYDNESQPLQTTLYVMREGHSSNPSNIPKD